VQLHFLSLFKNVQMCDRSFCHSLKMCRCAIALYVAPLKSGIVRLHFLCSLKKRHCVIKPFSHFSIVQKSGIAKRKSTKMCKKSKNFHIALFCTLKRAITHFQNVPMPNPGKGYIPKDFEFDWKNLPWGSFEVFKKNFLENMSTWVSKSMYKIKVKVKNHV